ncbi:ParB/RepB/Spo0J family partition protein [Rothia sp. ZJ1223]|uniref:ParB/RepB/Spo0J family partition protein n=1 Tax=Rothia sp. ZJ1223 TaxID=2811098 RepID=UPI00195726A8|nr:ParB/RepB/Spo0J family partition protein [Rothia sp. ZJ1223]
MAEKRRGLGRGLGALIPSGDENTDIFKTAEQEPVAQKSQTEHQQADTTVGSSATEKSVEPRISTPRKTRQPETAPVEQAAERPTESNTVEPDVNKVSKSKNNVSRETKKKRADMGVALRSAGATKRPADFFFGSENADTLVPVPGAKFVELKIADIHPNHKQPRIDFDEHDMQELVHSIQEIGILQPIVVRPSEDTNAPEKYELVMGERRWRASQRAGRTTIPAIIRETKNVDLLRDALLENLHRSQLNPIEEAAAYQQLLDEFGTTQEQLAQRIGRSRPQISNTIRLLKLPALVQRRVASGVLSAGHARALLGLKSAAEVERVAQKVVNEGLSVRAVEEMVLAVGSSDSKPARKPAQPQKHHERLDYIADAFADKLDTNVKIQLGARKGKMTIEFASVEDLNRIISVLDPQMDS